MKPPLLSDREADSAGYLTAAEILKGPARRASDWQLRPQRQQGPRSAPARASGLADPARRERRGSGATAHRRDGQGGLV